MSKYPKLLLSKIPSKTKSNIKKFLYKIKLLPFKKPLMDNKMRYVDNLKDLDIEIKKADERAQISDDEMRVALTEFAYTTLYKFPEDPYSPEYFESQIALYNEISGRSSYELENEYTPFDFDGLKNNPYPYCTKSAITVGDQLIAQGFIIKTMNLPPDSHILEFGAGWGNTTLNFVQMGYKATVVEIDPSLARLIKYRTELFAKEICLVQQDMLSFSKQDSGQYDAVLFYSCFHHCADHLSLLRNLHKLIKEDGLVAFAAEPVADFPHPWGIRLDGISVWSIRKFGWLELGFDNSYFFKTLLLLGWTPQRHRSNEHPLCDVIVAKKSNRYYEPSQITLPPDECSTWAIKETDPGLLLRFTKSKSVMTCEADINVNAIELCISNYAPFAIDITCSAGSSKQKFSIGKNYSNHICKLSVENWDGKIGIVSKTWTPAKTYRNGDLRELGVAVHSIRLLD